MEQPYTFTENLPGRTLLQQPSYPPEYLLLLQMPNPVAIMKGPEFRLEMVTPKLLELWGKEISEVLHQPYFNLFPHTRAEGLEEIYNHVYRTGTTYIRNEVLVPRKDKGRHWEEFYQIVLTPITNAHGHTEGIMATGFDVTAHVAARKQVEESESFSRSVLESSPDCVKLLDAEGRLSFMNRNGQCLMEIDDFCIVDGKLWWDLWPEQERQKLHDSVDKALTGKMASFQAFCPTAKGTPKWWDVLVAPMYDAAGKVSKIISVSRDISEIKRTETAIRESEERLALVISAANLGLWDYNIASNEAVLSEKSREYYNLQPDEPFTFERFLASIHPEDRDWVAEANRKVLTDDDAPTEFFAEFRVITRNGETKWNRSIGRVLINEQGKRYRFLGAIMDVTQEKAAARALEESENRFRTMADSAPVMIWVTDKEGYCTYLNKQWLDFTGQALEEGRGLGWAKAVHPDEREIVAHAFIAASKQALGYSKEYRLRKWDGSFEWMIDSAEPRFDETGAFEGYIGSVVNIHQRKLAEDRLKKLSYHLQLSTDAAGVGTWSLDVASGTLEWSGLHKKMWGYNEEQPDLTYDHWHRVILPEDQEKAGAALNQAKAQNSQYENEYRIKRVNDGVIRWMRSFGQFFYNDKGEPITLTGISIDITEQKTAEEALRQSEAYFRTLATTMPQMVWMAGSEGQFEYVSPKWLEYSGIRAPQEAWDYMVYPGDRKMVDDLLQLSFTRQTPFNYEVRLRNKEGIYRWHYAIGAPIKNKLGVVSRWVGTLTDFHDQKTFTERLEQEVAQRTKELHRSNEDLQQFAHVASHDLKEPVRKIKYFSSSLESQLQDRLTEREEVFLKKVQSAADRMASMIDGVLTYSTLGSLTQAIEPVNLNDLVDQIAEDLEVLVLEKNAAIYYNDLPQVEGAPVLLYQLFYNLINNSLKFSREDAKPEIHIHAESIHHAGLDWVQLRLRDNGIGFEPEYAEKIFGTFTRLNSKDQYEGTGLGLALCKKIVERHGGSISAEGNPDAGATFIITLPIN